MPGQQRPRDLVQDRRPGTLATRWHSTVACVCKRMARAYPTRSLCELLRRLPACGADYQRGAVVTKESNQLGVRRKHCLAATRMPRAPSWQRRSPSIAILLLAGGADATQPSPDSDTSGSSARRLTAWDECPAAMKTSMTSSMKAAVVSARADRRSSPPRLCLPSVKKG